MLVPELVKRNSLDIIVKLIRAQLQDNSFGFDLVNEPFSYLLDPGMNQTHYFGMASFTRLARCKNVLEIGTREGYGTQALARFSGKVTTCDIVDQRMDYTVNLSNVDFVLLDNPDECTKFDWTNYDCIFVDIGCHEGVYETIIHRQLFDSYKGIVFYDDIMLPKMKQLWDSISQPKIDLDWHNVRDNFTNNFGVVKYD